MKLRLNTNGLQDVIYQKTEPFTATVVRPLIPLPSLLGVVERLFPLYKYNVLYFIEFEIFTTEGTTFRQ
jgi:hypothetical protein